MFKAITNLLKHKTARQTAILFGSQIIAIILNILITPIITRNLGPEKYGIFVFIMAFISFISLFFEFGFFSAGARLLAESKDDEKDREIIGALVIVALVISFIFSITIFVFSFFIDGIFHTHAGNIIRTVSLLSFILPFQYMTQQCCQGTNKIKELSILNWVPEAWLLSGLLVIINFLNLDIFLTLFLSFSGIVIAVLLVFKRLNPRFIHVEENLKLILKETKEYGIHVYWGRIVDVSTYNLDKIFVSYFRDTVQTGFYGLSALLASPIPLLSQAISTTLFKDFSQKERIPKKVIIFNFLWLLFCVIGLTVLGRFFVTVLFSDRYLSVTPLIFPMALAGFFQGMYQPYIMFFTAHRKGGWVRNMAWMMAFSNFACNILFIPLWGAMGAALASAVSMAFAVFVYLFYYKKYLREEKLKGFL